MKDYYYILGIKRESNADVIKSAYRKLSKKFHPDLNNGDKFFEDRFKEIQEAYETLINVNKRELYDKFYEANTNKKDENIVVNQTNNSEQKYETNFANKKFRNEERETNIKFDNDLKSKDGKNIKKTKSFIKDTWKNERLYSVLFIITFIFWNIAFLSMHSQNNELTLGNLILTPIFSGILALIVAGLLTKIITSIIDLFNRS